MEENPNETIIEIYIIGNRAGVSVRKKNDLTKEEQKLINKIENLVTKFTA